MKVIESHEPLVDIRKACPNFVIRLNKSRKNEKTAYVRKTVALMLRSAQKRLPNNMVFVIRDAWRPAAVQEKIMQDMVNMFRSKYPTWTDEQVRQEADKYVAAAKGLRSSGHMTGGAIDIRLMRRGKLVPMRSWKLTYQENAEPYQPKLPKYLQNNREIMFKALQSVGFSQCHNEFWHWSYGDVHWAQRTGSGVAMYGTVLATE